VRRRFAAPSHIGLLVLGVGLAVTAALSWSSYVVHERNENRLLRLQTQQVATVLQAAIPALQTPLSSAAEIAAATAGDPARFRDYISSYVGAKGSFASASLWRVSDGAPTLVAGVGRPADLTGAAAGSFLTRAAARPALDITGPFGGARSRIGLAYASDSSPTYVVYAESSLPPGRHVPSESNSAFSDLRFAMYLGRTTDSDALLETNADRVPIAGHTSTTTVPFGSRVLTLVAAKSGQLGGALSAALWWIVALVASAVTIVAAFAAERLVRRRRAAERLSREVSHLLHEQRSIAETLQRALLPQDLPAIAGAQIATRYISGARDVDIGGDWYDVIALDGDRLFFAVGDVSGRGVHAGSVMAALHFAIRGFVSEGHGPAAVLDRLAELLDVTQDQHFATVLCGVADLAAGELTLANAGHLPPLLLGDGTAVLVATEVGPPIGVRSRGPYTTTVIRLSAGSTLLAFTDGLVERRGESLDDGLRRLRDSAAGAGGSVEDLLSTVVAELAIGDTGGFDDDTAILGVRWLG
jgi:serine phosphatase RsbU (regulator of sigma subunit)